MPLSTVQKVCIGFGITFAVVAVVLFVAYFIYDHNLKNKALDTATYATTAQSDVQSLLDSVSCLKQFYKTFEYFDANGEDKEYEKDENGKTTENTKAYVNATMEYSIGGIDGTGSGKLYQLRKSITPSQMVSKLGISSYYTSGESSGNDYILIHYNYPSSSVQKGVKVSLSGYTLSNTGYQGENFNDYIQSQISQNWENAFSGAEDRAICSV